MKSPEKNEVRNTVFDVEDLKKKNRMGHKIFLARKSRKLSQADLASSLKEYNINITPGAVGKWECGVSYPNGYQLLAVSRILGIKDLYDTYTDTEENADLLNDKGQNILNAVRNALIDCGSYSPQTAEGPETEKIISLKVFLQSAAAGTGNYLDDSSAETINFPESAVPEGTDFGILISGDSMLPRYYNGQIAMVKSCEELYPGQIGIFIYDGNSYIKKYSETDPDEDEVEDYLDSEGCIHRKIELVSLNPEYDNIEISPNAGFKIVGRVLN